MKQIKALLRPHMLDAVVDAIEELPAAPGLTVSRVQGFGHRAEGGPAQMTERIKLDIVVPDDDADRLVSVIEERARTGRAGDGKIFVTELSDAIRIRTGERGRAAVERSEEPPEARRTGD